MPNYTLKSPGLVGENLFETWFTNFDQITIYNQSGQYVKHKIANVENTLIIEKPGIYYISFNSGNQVFTKKLLIL
jgi:hypothetical protein